LDASVDIRPMRGEDLPEVGALTAELGYPGSLEAMRARFEALARRPEHATYVATLGDRTSGWLHARAQHALESDPVVEIVGLVVAAGVRRLGIGRELVAHAQRWARELGSRRLLVRTNVLREGAHDFYEALGFRWSKTQHVRVLGLD
jgi:GNAT superfamily N-acetyltransferase